MLPLSVAVAVAVTFGLGIKDGLLLTAVTLTTCVPPSPSEMPPRVIDSNT